MITLKNLLLYQKYYYFQLISRYRSLGGSDSIRKTVLGALILLFFCLALQKSLKVPNGTRFLKVYQPRVFRTIREFYL